MRYFLSGQLHWVALASGVLALVAGVSVSLWLLQVFDSPGPQAVGIEEDVGPAAREALPGIDTKVGQSGGLPLPGLPARGGLGVSGAAGPSTGAGTAATRDAPGPSFPSAAIAGDSVTTAAQEARPAPGRGGPGEHATVRDSVELVVRDASGKVRQRETVR